MARSKAATVCAIPSQGSTYQQHTRDTILTTHGSIEANALVQQPLVGRGNHVISVIPTYQQHYSILESIGAEIELLHLRPENGFLPDLAELCTMLTALLQSFCAPTIFASFSV